MSACCEVSYGYCECGCGEKTNLARDTIKARGQVAGQPVRYIRGHYNRKHDPVYRIDPETNCWIWQRSANKSGYGMRRSDGRQVFAHRFEYEQANGPIPDGLCLDHLCRNPSCVNPAHLEAVTPAENSRRGRSTKLTAEQVSEIRRAPTSAVPELAARLGVARSYIYQLRSVRPPAWRDVA